MLGWVIALAAVLLVGAWVVVTYNRLVRLRNTREEAWSGIDVQLARRADLVPNLVDTVRAYAGHEREVLEDVTEARTRLAAAGGPREAGAADEQLQVALGRLFAVAEGYPELRASDNFLALQKELARLEEDISFARRYHNAVVEQFNTAQQTFPNLLVARPLGFSLAEYFKADAEDHTVPSTSFGG